ncbi:MAG: MarR family transcriptional regulator [Clostridia bacterium]|nr:MarR family transcriptional regulator [Clostridia bacterium]
MSEVTGFGCCAGTGGLSEREMKLVFHLIPAFSHAFFEGHGETSVNLDGLNKTHVHAVVFLNIHGPSPMSAVARFLGLEKGSFTPIANRLLEWGFVTREVDPADRRRQVLQLTDSGREFAQRLRERRGVRFREQIDKLSKAERRQFFQALERLESLLVKMNDGAAIGHGMHRMGPDKTGEETT